VVTASPRTNTVSVLISRSDGTLKAPQKYAADSVADVLVREDLDGDGDRDLATANWDYAEGLGYVSVRLGRGDGTFGTQRRYATGVEGQRAIESGDFDGDGDKDLVTANQASETVSVFKNNGDGSFASARNFAAGDTGSGQDVDRSDLDGDEDEDLVVPDEDLGDDVGGVSVLMNDGNGTFGAPREYTTFQNSADAVLAKDLDGDGDRDLAAADLRRNVVDVYKNGGDGTFALRGSYPVYGEGVNTREGANALTEADFDSDGDTDIATANWGTDNVSVLVNAGDGTLGNPRVFGAGDSPHALVRARMNADSRPDLIVANLGTDDVSVLRNTTR
jgi:large repetitive protein